MFQRFLTEPKSINYVFDSSVLQKRSKTIAESLCLISFLKATFGLGVPKFTYSRHNHDCALLHADKTSLFTRNGFFEIGKKNSSLN